jgi:hypothetical protein
MLADEAAAVGSTIGPAPCATRSLNTSRGGQEMGRAVGLAVAQGHFRSDLDVDQFAFDMFGIILAYYHGARLLDAKRAESRARTAFDRLVAAASPNP